MVVLSIAKYCIKLRLVPQLFNKRREEHRSRGCADGPADRLRWRIAARLVSRVRAAGLAHRSPYALRHTFATFAIAAGIGLFELARFMGTSVEQIDRTYGHLLPDSRDRARTALDLFITNAAEAAEGGLS